MPISWLQATTIRNTRCLCPTGSTESRARWSGASYAPSQKLVEDGQLTKGSSLRYPPDTKEKQENLGGFFKKNSPPGVAKKLPDFVKAIQEKNPGIKSWGVIGVRNY